MRAMALLPAAFAGLGLPTEHRMVARAATGMRRLMIARLCNIRKRLFKRETAVLQRPGYGEPRA
jgi:hypothetical protein